jgi:cbb3-type cytochrome oxidase maturation protein
VSFLLVTIPISLLLAGGLLALVIHAVRTGAMDDWDGPAQRVLFDDDRTPELEGPRGGSHGQGQPAPARPSLAGDAPLGPGESRE